MCLLGAWLVGEWFEQRRGFAMGVIGIGGALSVATVPIANAWLIEISSWQETWITHAWVLGLCFVIPPYLFCLLYTSPSPRDATLSRMPSSA